MARADLEIDGLAIRLDDRVVDGAGSPWQGRAIASARKGPHTILDEHNLAFETAEGIVAERIPVALVRPVPRRQKSGGPDSSVPAGHAEGRVGLLRVGMESRRCGSAGRTTVHHPFLMEA
jgi:hypothetical protein